MDNDVNDFLRKIAEVESAGGKNFNHKEIKSGPQKGQTAIGTYGLLPNTVDEVVARSNDPALADLAKMSPKEQKAYLESNPDKEQLVARHLAEHVLARQDGNQEKAAYSWLNGHNLSPDNIEKRDYQESPYVQKFNKISDKMKSAPKSVKSSEVPPPPLDMGGTPEGDKVQDYLQNYSTKDMMKQHFADNQADLERAMEISSRGPFMDKTSEERDFEEKKLNPLARGLIQGGPVGGVASRTAYEAQPLATSVFNKLKSYIGTKPTVMSSAEFMARQSRNPDVAEVLRDIRQYTPNDPVLSRKVGEQLNQAALRDEALAATAAVENESAKDAAKYLDEPTDVLNKLRGK